MVLNESGKIIKQAWEDLPNHHPNIELGAFVIMPNHVQGVIIMIGAGLKPAPTVITKNHGIPEIVRAFKSFSARHVNEFVNTPGIPLWQRNYYEHIGYETEWNNINRSIESNPLRWEDDHANPK